MIPYQDMTFCDWNWYWGESVMFANVAGKWRAVRPIVYDEDEPIRFNESDTLEQIDDEGGTLKFAYWQGGKTFRVSPLTPFDSNDWITYEPPLGYFILDHKLVLIASQAPRNRVKGLHPRRLANVVPLDVTAMPTCVRNVISLEQSFNLHYASIIAQIEDRMNTPFPDSWYKLALAGIRDHVTPAVILHRDVALVPVAGKDYGHLLFKGTLIGRLYATDTRLRFTPRTKPTTNIESAVNSWVISKIAAV